MATCIMVQDIPFRPIPLGSPFVVRARTPKLLTSALRSSLLLSSGAMSSMQSDPNTAARFDSTGARSGQTPAIRRPRTIPDMNDATTRLVVALELEEAQSLKDSSNGTSDCAMARRIAIDQLLSCRAINEIEQMTNAEISRTTTTSPSTTDFCTVCEDPLERDKAWQTPCEHWYCLDCIETLVRTSTTDETLYPPRCCVVLPWVELKALVSEDIADNFEDKKKELDTPAERRVYCAEPVCSHFLGSQDALGVVASSPVCAAETCTSCRSASHAAPCPKENDEALQQTLKLARERGWQSCQRCKRIIDLLPFGCNHMACPCGHHFCYVCGERWKTCRCPMHGIPVPEVFELFELDDVPPALNHVGHRQQQDRLQRFHVGMQLTMRRAETHELEAAMRELEATFTMLESDRDELAEEVAAMDAEVEEMRGRLERMRAELRLRHGQDGVPERAAGAAHFVTLV